MKYKLFIFYQLIFVIVYFFFSAVLNTRAKFSVYVPGNLEGPAPVLYHLSGMLCSEQTFIQKAGFQRWAAHYGIIVVSPDVCPSKKISKISLLYNIFIHLYVMKLCRSYFWCRKK